jgi:hypothetical protein
MVRFRDLLEDSSEVEIIVVVDRVTDPSSLSRQSEQGTSTIIRVRVTRYQSGIHKPVYCPAERAFINIQASRQLNGCCLAGSPDLQERMALGDCQPATAVVVFQLAG